MWHYLIAEYYSYAFGGSAGPAGWKLPPEAEALGIELRSSLGQGFAILGQHDWELVGVTRNAVPSYSIHTSFFKKPA